MPEPEVLNQEMYEEDEVSEPDEKPLLSVVEREEDEPVEQGTESPKIPVMQIPPHLADVLDTPEKQQAFWSRTAQAHQLAQEVAAQRELEQRREYEQFTARSEIDEIRRRNAELDAAAEYAVKMLPRTATNAERDEAVRVSVMAKKREHDMRDMAQLADAMYGKYHTEQTKIAASRAAFFANEENKDLAPFRDMIERMVDQDGIKAHKAAEIIRNITKRTGYKQAEADFDDTELYAAGFSSRAADALKKQIRAAGMTEAGRFGTSVPKEVETKHNQLASRIVDDFFGKSGRKQSKW